MHSLLESYLAEVEAKLTALPAKRREEEMREMRQHLLNAMEANRERGQSEDEAAGNTLAEFGPTENAAGGILAAWRSEQRLQWRDLIGAAACTLAFLFILPRLLFQLVINYVTCTLQPHQSGSWVGIDLFLLELPLYFLVGAVSGFAFPRRAMAGVGLTFMALQLFFLVHSSLTLVGHHLSLLQLFVERLKIFGLFAVLEILATCLTAWAVRQWRRGKMGHPAAVAE